MDTLTYLQKIFPIRNCTKMLPQGCLNYHIKRCTGPCMGKISRKEYMKILDEFVKVLKGKGGYLLRKLKEQEAKAVEELKFEQAGQYKKNLDNLQKIITTQSLVVQPEKKDLDVINFKTYDYLKYYFIVLKIRQGKLIFKENLHLKSAFVKDNQQILKEFLQKYYLEQKNEVPQEIVVPESIGDSEKKNLEIALGSVKVSE